MKIQLEDKELVNLIVRRANDIAQKLISQTISQCNVKEMACNIFKQRFERELQEMLNDGSLYDKIAKSMAKTLSSEVVSNIYSIINIEEVQVLVADKLADRIAREMSKNLLIKK